MSRIITEREFSEKIHAALIGIDAGFVTGPGRSGAISAVYASHILRIPFIPYGCAAPDLGRCLVIDTAVQTGKTLRKAAKKYKQYNPIVIHLYDEPPIVRFWYEAKCPQIFKHEEAA